MIKGKWVFNYNNNKREVDWDLVGTVGIFGKDSISMKRTKAVPWNADRPFTAHIKTRWEYRQREYFRAMKILGGNIK